MEVCPKTELIAIEDPATVCDSAFQIGEGREAQMIRHMRHGSSPGLMAPQPILSPNRRESLPTPLAGVRMTPHQLSLLDQGPTLPPGLRYQTDVISSKEEQELVDQLAALPFRAFEFQGYLGKRRVLS